MYYLATLFPALSGRRLLLSRDQWMLLLAAVNLLFLGLDTYLAHMISGTIRSNEWIPILFGFTAGAVLLLAGLIALRNRPLATRLATLVFVASVVVGLLGSYFHLLRAALPAAPVGQRLSLALFVWAPPLLAPLSFTGVGIWGLSAAWMERPPDSGRLVLGRGRRLRLPYSKTRAYLFLVGLGLLVTLISSVLDHARSNFANPWVWLPVVVGIFGLLVTVGLAAIDRPSRADIMTFVAAMLLLMGLGLLGALLHVQFDLTGKGVVVPERFLRGAPFLAPLLFANMGLVGLASLLDPAGE